MSFNRTRGFQASAAVQMRSLFFLDVPLRRLVVSTDVSVQPIGPILKGRASQEDCLTLENGTDKLFRNVGD
jgi:hypothetical protein